MSMNEQVLVACPHGRWSRCDEPTCPGPLNIKYPTLFDPPAGLEAKQEGMATAIKNATTEWKDNFRDTAALLASKRQPFTSEDITHIVGLPRGRIGKDLNNSVGAMMNGMARSKKIGKTGRRVLSKRPTSHGAELTEWIGI